MDEPNASNSPRADVPVYNCHVLVSPRDAEGWIVARSSTLPEVTARGRSEREALANLVAAFKTAILHHTADGGTVPWAAQPLEPRPGDQQRWIAVHL
ncbi:MAG TPA: hypothetical protein VND64_30910 [Pirellulales bacterium]|nr:hypothetical protein [Pirellulales bacterium]